MEILQMGAEMFHVDGKTNKHDEANSFFFTILQTRLKIEFLSLFVIHSFHWHAQNVTIHCRSQELLQFVITELTIKFSQCFLIFTPPPIFS
jgi:hypothetical protein